MPFLTLSQGLTIKVPTPGTRNWSATILSDTWTKISSHDHSGAGNGTQVPTAGLADDSVTTAKIAPSIALTQAAALTPSGTTQTVNFATGNIQQLSLASASGDVTLTLSNPESGGTYKIWITQGATARNITWPASVKWPQAQAPILSTANGGVDLVELYYTGSVYRGTWELDFS